MSEYLYQAVPSHLLNILSLDVSGLHSSSVGNNKASVLCVQRGKMKVESEGTVSLIIGKEYMTGINLKGQGWPLRWLLNFSRNYRIF